MTRAWETFGIEQVRSFWKVLVKMKLLELNRLPELNMLPEFGRLCLPDSVDGRAFFLTKGRFVQDEHGDVLEDDGLPEDRIVVSVASVPTEQNEAADRTE